MDSCKRRDECDPNKHVYTIVVKDGKKRCDDRDRVDGKNGKDAEICIKVESDCNNEEQICIQYIPECYNDEEKQKEI